MRVSPGSPEAFVLATTFVIIASLARWALGFISDDVVPLVTYYPAVLFAALIGGMAAGAYATILSGFIAWWAFMSPPFSLLPLTSGQQVSLVTYLFAALMIVWGADHYRRMSERVENEEHLRKLATAELAHRLKNKLATIHSIISFQLRELACTRFG